MTQRSFCSFEKNRCPTLPPTVEYSLRWLCGASHAKGWAFSTTSLLPTIHRRMVWLRGFTASLKIPCPKPKTLHELSKNGQNRPTLIYVLPHVSKFIETICCEIYSYVSSWEPSELGYLSLRHHSFFHLC